MKIIYNDEQLIKRCQELGIDIKGNDIIMPDGSKTGREPRAHDSELQRRVIEAERSIRESKFWIIALVSAIASAISAITAIIAVSISQ